MLKCNVAIVGCGLAGVAAALAIQRAGHQVTIFEKANSLNEIGAGIQLPYNCTRILSKWGILSIIESYAVRPSNIVLRRYEDGRVLFKASLPALNNESDEEIPHLLIHRADFLKVLFDEAIRGADGINSVCRRLLFGDTISPRFSGDAAYRLTIPITDIERDEGVSKLLEDSDVSCWMGPSRHAICYRLKEGSLLNVVLVGPDDAHRSRDAAQSDQQDMKTLFRDWDPCLQRMFQLAKKVLKSRLNDSHEMASWSHSDGKFALVGDACHASLPFLAQGAAQALEDAAVLGHLFSKIQHRNQIKDIVQTYESIRKPRTSRVIAGSEARGAVYQLPDGKAQQDRDRQLTLAREGTAYPSCMGDLSFQSWLLHYDIGSAVERIWEQNQSCST